jgi:hypothetical protein
MAGIIWLASYPKSGNTWVRLFLENLLISDESPIDINSQKHFITGDTGRPWWLRYFGPQINDMGRREILGHRADMLSYFTGLSEGSVCLKTHCANARILDCRQIPPESTAAAIYIIRNPLDVVGSLAHFWNASLLGTVRIMADEGFWLGRDRSNVAGFMSSWSAHVLSWTRHEHPNLIVVRYEDMLAKPFQTFERLARHAGLTPSADEIERALSNSSFGSLKKQEEEAGFVEAPEGRNFFRKGKAGQWREELKGRLVDRIVRDHGAVMERFGYLPDNPVSYPSAAILSEERFPKFEADAPFFPLNSIYKPVDPVGFNLRL